MKVLFTGTICVGKTTLLNRLRSERIEGCVLIDEVARKLLEQKPELERKSDFQELHALSSNPRLIICDRGSVDIVAYTRLFGHPVKPEWLAWCHTYDKVFFLNKEDVPFNDDVIKADLHYDKGRNWIDFRDSVERQIIDVLSDFQIPYSVLNGSIDQRFLRISKEMDHLRTQLEFRSAQRERGY